nr:MAG TPA: hypothetical protein [Caudoviricetes sp.]
MRSAPVTISTMPDREMKLRWVRLGYYPRAA